MKSQICLIPKISPLVNIDIAYILINLINTDVSNKWQKWYKNYIENSQNINIMTYYVYRTSIIFWFFF